MTFSCTRYACTWWHPAHCPFLNMCAVKVVQLHFEHGGADGASATTGRDAILLRLEDDEEEVGTTAPDRSASRCSFAARSSAFARFFSASRAFRSALRS